MGYTDSLIDNSMSIKGLSGHTYGGGIDFESIQALLVTDNAVQGQTAVLATSASNITTVIRAGEQTAHSAISQWLTTNVDGKKDADLTTGNATLGQMSATSTSNGQVCSNMTSEFSSATSNVQNQTGQLQAQLSGILQILGQMGSTSTSWQV